MSNVKAEKKEADILRLAGIAGLGPNWDAKQDPVSAILRGAVDEKAALTGEQLELLKLQFGSAG
jgi:hypothetical protein